MFLKHFVSFLPQLKNWLKIVYSLLVPFPILEEGRSEMIQVTSGSRVKPKEDRGGQILPKSSYPTSQV